MILKLSCPDQPGLVARITEFIARNGGNILELSQFTDPISRWFFLRLSFDSANLTLPKSEFSHQFAYLGQELKASWQFREAGYRMPAAILVTHESHCLNDLLARCQSGELPMEIRAIISNRHTLEKAAGRWDMPFVHLSVDKEDKEKSFRCYREQIEECGAELVILARFMQIIPSSICRDYFGRIINIHHSFLPAFVGANPYRQAFERGVKIIGATSHYVTAELDAGPIIEQEVRRVEHYHTPQDLQRLGRDCECLALSNAVRYHAADRVIIHGNKTVVFRD